MSYRGEISVTRSGRTCQAWSSQSPHPHQYPPELFSTAGLDENYCRNPDGNFEQPWCITMDPEVQAEYCSVPLCEGTTTQPNGNRTTNFTSSFISSTTQPTTATRKISTGASNSTTNEITEGASLSSTSGVNSTRTTSTEFRKTDYTTVYSILVSSRNPYIPTDESTTANNVTESVLATGRKNDATNKYDIVTVPETDTDRDSSTLLTPTWTGTSKGKTPGDFTNAASPPTYVSFTATL
ncbi:uncharacterized protein LOC144861722 [Branchiostoma floridae x Branchiostoma japonicum]